MNITGNQGMGGLQPFTGGSRDTTQDMAQQILPALLNRRPYSNVLDLESPQHQPIRPWWYDLMNYGSVGSGPGNQGGAGLYVPPLGGFSGSDDDLLNLRFKLQGIPA